MFLENTEVTKHLNFISFWMEYLMHCYPQKYPTQFLCFKKKYVGHPTSYIYIYIQSPKKKINNTLHLWQGVCYKSIRVSVNAGSWTTVNILVGISIHPPFLYIVYIDYLQTKIMNYYCSWIRTAIIKAVILVVDNQKQSYIVNDFWF